MAVNANRVLSLDNDSIIMTKWLNEMVFWCSSSDLYWCARASQWGDLLPVLYQPEECNTSRVDQNTCENICTKNSESGQPSNEDKTIGLHMTPDVV